MIVRITSEQDRSDTVVEITFGYTAAAGSHTGCGPFGSVICGQPDRENIPTHFGAALTFFVEETFIAGYPPCLELCNDHNDSPEMNKVSAL